MCYRKSKLNVDLANNIFAKNNYDCFQPELTYFHYDCEKEEHFTQNLNWTIHKKYLTMRSPKFLKSYRLPNLKNFAIIIFFLFSIENGILTLRTKLYEIQYVLDFLNLPKNEVRWGVYTFKILKQKFNFKILNEAEVKTGQFFFLSYISFKDLPHSANNGLQIIFPRSRE